MVSKSKDKKQDVGPRERTNSNARFKDLCNEDKAKIGELVKKLADAERQKSEFERILEQERQDKETERVKMQDKF